MTPAPGRSVALLRSGGVGRAAGVVVSQLPDGTLLGEAGLRRGDILTSINDVPIDGMGTLASLWGRLQGESTIRAIVLRDGEAVPLVVSLR